MGDHDTPAQPPMTDGSTGPAEHSKARHGSIVEGLETVAHDLLESLAHDFETVEAWQESLLDEGLEETFPASDPVSVKAPPRKPGAD